MSTTKYTAMFEQCNVSLRSLALRCVRDDLPMSVCASVAALPSGAPLPREIKVDPSFEQRVAEAEARVEHLAALSAEEEEAHAEDEFARDMERYRAEIGRVTTLNARLRATEAEILLWAAPAEFELLRKDMLREVRAAFVDMKYVEGLRPTQRPGRVWRAEQVRVASAALALARQELKTEHLRVERANQALARLLASLPST